MLGRHLGGHFESNFARHIGLWLWKISCPHVLNNVSDCSFYQFNVKFDLTCRLLPFIGRFLHNLIHWEPFWRPFWKRLWAPYWLKWEIGCLRVPKHVSDCSFYQIYVILAFTGRLFLIYWQICAWFDTSAAILVAILETDYGAILA